MRLDRAGTHVITTRSQKQSKTGVREGHRFPRRVVTGRMEGGLGFLRRKIGGSRGHAGTDEWEAGVP